MRHFCILLVMILCGNAAAASNSPTLRDVNVGLYLVDITKIDEISNTYTAELDVYVSWLDSTLAFDAETEGASTRIYSGKEVEKLRSGIWAAQIFPTNPVGKFSAGGEKMLVHSDGRAELTARLSATLRARLDYRSFPFDTQVLPMELESFPWNRDQVRLVQDQEHTGFDQLYALAEWEIMGLEVEQYETTRVRDVVPFSNLVFKFSVKRDSGFYLWKIFLTVVIIVSLTWVVFWMSGEGLGRRAGVSSGGILTVIAYQFVTTSSLPRVSYLTVADKVMILSVVIIAATMVESVLVDRLTHTDLARKTRIDRICRVGFPTFYFLSLLVLALKNGLFA
jgi:hypothetical protein